MARADEDTPLDVFLDPEDILKMVKKETKPDYAKYLLLGYFFSLRPQEIFGLKVSDFRAGTDVLQLEASKAMVGLDLYGQFVVHVQRQKTKKNKLAPPKKNSKGWVTCFNKEAATAFVQLVADKNPDDYVLDCEPNAFYKDWPYDFEPKDTRRASLYWLGHNTDITQTQMMKHARQKNPKSLELYLRRPEEVLEKWSGLKVSDL
jgi:integrase